MNVPMRAGNYMLKTQCDHCSATFSSPNRALTHLEKRHRAKKFVPPAGTPLFKVEWNRNGTIARDIMLGMEMGETWDARVPETPA